jgi:hypothetical protein
MEIKAVHGAKKRKHGACLLLPPPPKSQEILAKLVDQSNAIAQSCGQIRPNLRTSITHSIHTLRL